MLRRVMRDLGDAVNAYHEIASPHLGQTDQRIVERVAEIFGSVVPLGHHDTGVGGQLDTKPRRRGGGAPVLSSG
jgi:hypothetical protein